MNSEEVEITEVRIRLPFALKECSETEYWLELLIESGYYQDRTILEHCIEVKRILIASINTVKTNNTEEYLL